ncbi:319_t:CDS:2, partial [Gigaspora rosea]
MSTSTSTSTTPINNIKNLAYNILKTFKDGIVKGIKITELEHCSVCKDEIITHPLKAFTTLSCGHVFHRICIEKELLLTMPNTCPFSGCSKEVEIIETNARRGSESSTSSVVRGMEKQSIQSQDMPDLYPHNIMIVEEYFNKKHTEWNIIGFLNECDKEPFQLKLDLYLRSLENIASCAERKRKEKAQLLLDRYRKAIEPQNQRWGTSNHLVYLMFKSFSRSGGMQPDRKLAKHREEVRSSKHGSSVHFHHSTMTITGNSVIGDGQIKRNFSSQKKRTKTADEHEDKNEDENEGENEGEKEDENEDDENLEFDLDSVIKSLQQEPLHEWKVCGINVTQKFSEYQQEALKTLKTTGLTWHNTYEVLALSSIIVLCRNCPYPNFTDEEWQTITQTSKYIIHEPVIPASVSTALHEIVNKHLLGQDSYMHADETILSRAVARTFNELRENVPDLAPQRISEDEHCRLFLNPYTSPIFLKKNNNYEVRLNRAVKGTKQRPDLSCVVDGVPLLNSEIKPMGSRPFNKKKDFAKIHLRARNSINQQLTSKGGPGETAMLLNH